jgi:hypothetical protein
MTLVVISERCLWPLKGGSRATGIIHYSFISEEPFSFQVGNLEFGIHTKVPIKETEKKPSRM